MSKRYLQGVKRMPLSLGRIFYLGEIPIRTLGSIQLKVHFRCFVGGDGTRQVEKTKIGWGKMQTHTEELYNAIFRILTFQWPFTRYSDGPVNFIPSGTFHCSVRCPVLNDTVIAEEKKKQRDSVPVWHSYMNSPGSTRKFLPPTQRLMVQRQRHPPSHHTPFPTLPALGCSSVFLLSQHHLCIRAKDIVKLTNPFPTQQVRVFKT